MIFRLEFHTCIPCEILRDFFKNPKGTCLASSSAVNITPPQIQKEKGLYISFWHIEDDTMIQYYGNKVCIVSLTTYPGVKSAYPVLSHKKISYDDIDYNISAKDMYEMLLEFV